MELYLNEVGPTAPPAIVRRGAAALVAPALLGFLASPRLRESPERWQRLIRRYEPVHRSAFGFWLVSSHAEAAVALRHPDLGSDPDRFDPAQLDLHGLQRLLGRRRADTDAGGPYRAMSRRLMLFRDPPDHTRLRSLVSRAFTRRRVASLETRIEAIADELVGDLAAVVARAGRADLMTRVAHPLPARVICELLGMPPGEHSFIAAHGRDLAGGLDPLPSTAAVARADRAVGALRSHLLGVIAARRRMPADDLVSALVAACDGGDRLADDELVATLVLLLIAGHETTANLIGNAMVVLDAHPSQAAALGGDDEVADTAVDELLRFDPPVQIAQRVALAPVALGGRTVPAGAAVIVSLSAANRDPDPFADPDRLDLARSPNPHLSFGAGVHHCLGAALARAEGRIALRALTRQRTRLRVARPYPRHRPSLTVRGYGHLPVELP